MCRKALKEFILGGRPDIHCVSSVITCALAFILGACLTSVNGNINVIPPIISTTALLPLPRAILQTFHLFAIYSILVYLREKYYQLSEFNFNPNLNLVMYCSGLTSALLFPLIFIFDLTNFDVVHNTLTFACIALALVYFWFHAFATRFLWQTEEQRLRVARDLFYGRLILSVLLTCDFVALFSLGTALKLVSAASLPEKSLSHQKIKISIGVLQWIMLIFLWLQFLLGAAETKPRQMKRTLRDTFPSPVATISPQMT